MPNKITGGKPGPGRPKGSPNKVTAAAKEVIASAAAAIGGQNRLVKWIHEDPKNEHAFWSSIYPKLLPLQLTGEGGGPIDFKATRETALAEVSELFGEQEQRVIN